jgi:hypothetical protein
MNLYRLTVTFIYMYTDSLLPPKEPINFNKGFSISESMDEKLILEQENGHPLDSRITFHAESHVYSYNNVPMDLSGM